MNVCLATFLIYSETIFSEMLMYMIITFEMQMIYKYHINDLISENSESKMHEQIYWKSLPSFVKNSQLFHIFKKI